MRSLVAPRLAEEDDGVAMGRETVAGEVDVVADALRGVAVVAHAINLAGCVTAQAGRVDGCSDIAGARQCGLDRGGNLVEADDMNHIVRSPRDGGDTVATSVNVDDDTVLSNRIGAGQEVVHIHGIKVALALLLSRFGLVSINHLIVSVVNELLSQTHLTDGL